MMTGLVSLLAAIFVLGTLSPLLVPLTLVAALPDAWAALRSARMRYQVSYELGVRQAAQADPGRPDGGPLGRARGAVFNMRGFLLRSYDVLASYERNVRMRLARRQSLVRLAGDAAGGIGIGIVYLVLGVLVAVGWIGLPAAGTAMLSIQLAVSALSGLLLTANQCYESGLYVNDYLTFCQQADAQHHHNADRDTARAAGILGHPDLGAQLHVPGHGPSPRSRTCRSRSAVVRWSPSSERTARASRHWPSCSAGLYEPESGEIRWDERSMADMDREELRERIAVIMQDYNRWPMTALENITMGRPRDDRLLAKATTAAGAERLVNSFPNGYDTPLDRRFRGGVEPSGGQWQRIAAARGFYRDGDLLICDEPTASLDARAEHAIFEMIREHSDGSTVLLITHRLASVRYADRIYVLDHGRVVEHGNHDTLLTGRRPVRRVVHAAGLCLCPGLADCPLNQAGTPPAGPPAAAGTGIRIRRRRRGLQFTSTRLPTLSRW